MRSTVSTAPPARPEDATPAELAAVARFLGVEPATMSTTGAPPQVTRVGAGPDVVSVVVVMGERAGRVVQPPRFLIRKGLKGWRLVFEGEEESLPDEMGVYYVAYLLKNPPLEPLHATELANAVLGDAVVEGQRNSGADDGETWARHREARQMCLAVLDDDKATAEMKAAAELELAEINDWALKHRRGTEGGIEHQVRAVRANIRRLLESLAAATDDRKRPHAVLRAFGKHLEKYLWHPSSRGSQCRNARVKAGLAGRFTYEPPEGVRWSS